MATKKGELIKDLRVMATWLRNRPRSEVEVLLTGDQGYETVQVLTMTDDEMRDLAKVISGAATFLGGIVEAEEASGDDND